MADIEQKKPRHETVMDVGVQRLGDIYAKAALGAAGDLSAQQSLVEELESLVAEALDPHPRLEEVFRSALIGEEEKLALLDRLFAETASEKLLNLLRVMTRHRRLGYIRSVARSARTLLEDRSGRIHIELQLPAPVSDDLEREIRDTIGGVLGGEPTVSTRINPDLLAGFVARVGDRVFDASARTSLEHSRQAMLQRCVEAIQNRPEQFIAAGENAPTQ